MSRLLSVIALACAFAGGALAMHEYRVMREDREPLGRLAHIGVLVPDLDLAIKSWQAMGFRNIQRVDKIQTQALYRGKPIAVTLRRAFVGDELNPQIELLQPVTDIDNPWGSELHEKGAVIHHIAFWPTDAAEAVRRVRQAAMVPIAGNSTTRASDEVSWTYLQAPGNALIIEILASPESIGRAPAASDGLLLRRGWQRLRIRTARPTAPGRSVGRVDIDLTCDYLVTYYSPMVNDDVVFKALADATRRRLLDLLHRRDGQTLGELETPLAMSRFGVMKHLRVLENAGLVLTRRAGREKHHFLNAVPIRLIHDRWIDKYTAHHVAALADLKSTLENTKWKSARKRA